MKKIKKADAIIVIVLLMIVGLVFVFKISGKNDDVPMTSASELQGVNNNDNSSGKVEDRPLSYYAENGRIGAITGGLYEVELYKRYPNAEILQYNAQPDLAIALSEGKIDAFT